MEIFYFTPTDIHMGRKVTQLVFCEGFRFCRRGDEKMIEKMMNGE